MRIRHLPYLLLLLLTFTASVSPDLAQARAGSGSSMGSRGTRSYQASPSGAQALQRSTAPQTTNSPAASPITGGSPFMSGLAGGILGMGIGHLLFGGGDGMGGGGLIHLLLIGGLIYYAVRFFRNRAMPGAPPLYSNATPVAADSQSINVTDSDIAAFKQALLDIQQAWSDGNFDRLRYYVTPEMLHYFNDELAANTSRGVANKVEQVQVEGVQPVESWREYNLSYAGVILQWSALDYMTRPDGTVASGSATQAERVREQWTFSRADGGNWLLSAIQQLS